MKTRFLILIASVFFFSCSSYISIVNETSNPMTVISILNKDEQSNLNLTFDSIVDKNVLKESLKPSQSIRVKKDGYASVVAISEDYDFYLQNNVQENRVIINKSNYNSSESLIPESKPDIIKLKISNQSKYTINKVIVEISPLLKSKTEKQDMMNFWNLIFPSQQREINFEYYGSAPYKIKEIIIQGSLENKNIEKIYTQNLDGVIVFEE